MSEERYIWMEEPDRGSPEYKALPPHLQDALWSIWLTFIAHRGVLAVSDIVED